MLIPVGESPFTEFFSHATSTVFFLHLQAGSHFKEEWLMIFLRKAEQELHVCD